MTGRIGSMCELVIVAIGRMKIPMVPKKLSFPISVIREFTQMPLAAACKMHKTLGSIQPKEAALDVGLLVFGAALDWLTQCS